MFPLRRSPTSKHSYLGASSNSRTVAAVQYDKTNRKQHIMRREKATEGEDRGRRKKITSETRLKKISRSKESGSPWLV